MPADIRVMPAVAKSTLRAANLQVGRLEADREASVEPGPAGPGSQMASGHRLSQNRRAAAGQPASDAALDASGPGRKS
jgi:hypothetical protein